MVSHDLHQGPRALQPRAHPREGRGRALRREGRHRPRRVRGHVPRRPSEWGCPSAMAKISSRRAQFKAILRKDIVMELRTGEMLTSMGLYTLLTLVVYCVALSQAGIGLRRPAHRGGPAVARVHLHVDARAEPLARAREGPGLSRGAAARRRWTGRSSSSRKTIGNLIFLLIVEVLTVPVFYFLFLSGRPIGGPVLGDRASRCSSGRSASPASARCSRLCR